jgi:colicin import membrane protein
LRQQLAAQETGAAKARADAEEAHQRAVDTLRARLAADVEAERAALQAAKDAAAQVSQARTRAEPQLHVHPLFLLPTALQREAAMAADSKAAAEKGEAAARALSETHAKALADLRAAHKGELDEARAALKALEAQVRPVPSRPAPPRPIPSTSHAVTWLLI